MKLSKYYTLVNLKIRQRNEKNQLTTARLFAGIRHHLQFHVRWLCHPRGRVRLPGTPPSLITWFGSSLDRLPTIRGGRRCKKSPRCLVVVGCMYRVSHFGVVPAILAFVLYTSRGVF
jgi:hypothetical protein